MSDNDIVETMRALAGRARVAARDLARADRAKKDAALQAIAGRLRSRASEVLEANRADVARFREADTATPAFVDRLTLSEARLEGVARSVLDVAGQEDPVGSISGMTRR